MSVQGCEGAILKDNKRGPFRCAEGPSLSVYAERRSNVGQGFCRGNLNPSRDDTVPRQQEETGGDAVRPGPDPRGSVRAGHISSQPKLTGMLFSSGQELTVERVAGFRFCRDRALTESLAKLLQTPLLGRLIKLFAKVATAERYLRGRSQSRIVGQHRLAEEAHGILKLGAMWSL